MQAETLQALFLLLSPIGQLLGFEKCPLYASWRLYNRIKLPRETVLHQRVRIVVHGCIEASLRLFLVDKNLVLGKNEVDLGHGIVGPRAPKFTRRLGPSVFQILGML